MLIMLLVSCNFNEEADEGKRLVNTTHLDRLYEEIRIGQQRVGMVHIYCEFPDYHFVDDADEGFACVDDVSRAAIFYAREFNATSDPEYLRKAVMLTRFLLAMQAPNGYYYNFVWPDGKIHMDGRTSHPAPTWWSWRALWAMGEVYDAMAGHQELDSIRSAVTQQRLRLVEQVMKEDIFRSDRTDTIEGIVVPTWLPEGTSADQAGILMMGLILMLRQQETDKEVAFVARDPLLELIRHLGKGIMMMQVHQPDSVFDGAFLSGGNIWHAFGNIQSAALLEGARYTQDSMMKEAALDEVDHFYPAFLKAGGWDHFWVRKTHEVYSAYDQEAFPQIAYGRRPMIWACLSAYRHTGDQKYLETAVRAGNWFFGDNPAGQPMYDPATGRGFDGINAPDHINRNAGAESTIEALLSLQALQQAGVGSDPATGKLKRAE